MWVGGSQEPSGWDVARNILGNACANFGLRYVGTLEICKREAIKVNFLLSYFQSLEVTIS